MLLFGNSTRKPHENEKKILRERGPKRFICSFLQFSLIPIFAAFICQAHKLGDWLGRKVD